MFLKINKQAYISSLEIENVKCFKDKQILKFSDDKSRPYQWTVILGDNGNGKTTILRSILSTKEGGYSFEKKSYINLLGITEASNIKIEYIVNDGFEIDDIKFRKRGKGLEAILKEESSGVSHFFGYGANRIGDKDGLDLSEILLSSTLLDEDLKLIGVESFILTLDHVAKIKKTIKSEREYQIVRENLLNVLPDVDDLRISVANRISYVEFLTPYGWVRYSDMSLGYRTVTAWILDLIVRMFIEYPNSKSPLEQPAVVLVDEIDLHMHPKWQQKIMSYLSERFPRTQFIVTAHSPLIVQSAIDANVIVLKREKGQVIVENNPVEVKTWRIDQILSSELFDLKMSRNSIIQEKIERRKILTVKGKLSDKEKKELLQLDKEVESLPIGESPEIIRAMEFIQQAAKQLEK